MFGGGLDVRSGDCKFGSWVPRAEPHTETDAQAGLEKDTRVSVLGGTATMVTVGVLSQGTWRHPGLS